MFLWRNKKIIPDENLSECQWIFTKFGVCIDIVEVWFGIANGQISSIFNSYCPLRCQYFCSRMIMNKYLGVVGCGEGVIYLTSP